MMSIKNLTLNEKLSPRISVFTPPFERTSNASGTIKTLNPCYVSTFESVVIAVVFPEQGPPVMQIRWIWYWFCERAYK